MFDENVGGNFEIFPYEIAFSDKVLNVAKTNVPHWGNVCAIQIHRINNALINDVFVLERSETNDDNGIPKKALLRIYGKQMDRIISKKREIELAMKLSMEHLGPKIYFTFNNGRLEEFVESEMLSPTLMRQEDIFLKVAKKLAKMHRWLTLQHNHNGSNGELWKRIEDWFDKVGVIMLQFTDLQLQRLKNVGFPDEIEKMWKCHQIELQNFPDAFVHSDVRLVY